jgi:hypothetical protein
LDVAPALTPEDGAEQEQCRIVAKHAAMERLASDLDDVLATIPLVLWNEALAERLFSRLVDLLLEGIAAELRTDLSNGRITTSEYGDRLRELAHQCRTAGLLDA